MKGEVKPLLDIIDGKNKILEIPVYQRNYDWGRENIEKMFQDLLGMAQTGKKSHFFGSIVTQTEDGQEVIVIDGQQRLTSVTLLLLALRTHFLLAGNQMRADEIYETYLYNKFSDKNSHFKLKPIKRDLEHYKKLYESPEDFERPSNMTTNYEYFFNAISTMSITFDGLLHAIEKLDVMQLSLQSDDDPQLIFESINSTGLDLTDADKVRNLLLMNEDYSKQTEYFERYWSPIEQKSQYDVTPLIKYWLTNKLGRVPNNNRIYFDFKYYIQRYSDKRELFEELLMYANNYEMILSCSSEDAEINAIMRRDSYLQITSQYPFYLGFLADVKAGKLRLADFKDVLLITENYLFRRTIVEVPTNALNKIFATLHRDVMRRLKPEYNYVSVLAAILKHKADSGRFPDDVEFKEKLGERDIYRLKPGVRSFLFERLENYNHKEVVDVFEGLEQKKLSIEHIMPQTLNAQWKQELGQDYLDVYRQYINSLGNLTLTGYNPEMQNFSFERKKMFYMNSHLGITREIVQYDHWNREEIENRTSELTERMLSIFPSLHTDYHDPIQTHDLQPFDPNFEYTGKKIVGYTFQTDAYRSKTVWKDMLIEVVSDLYDEYPEQINNLVIQDATGKGSMLTNAFKSQQEEGYSELRDGVYLNTSTSTWMKMHTLMQLFDFLHVSYDDLQFQLGDSHSDERDAVR
ncbi:DUF262 domain-containing protein [Lacticaseibacillus jixianensis]|uniref:DUF262 domain-containing protein n=1 Tax=Lacticaseibacillus jixianensis TaxID=2486012 RepID=A0ABW4B560_9LACO|nr:DUF262 domain-containing protein [Lacticaseibacillus jixianensis]